MTTKTYTHGDLTVMWKAELCSHSERCFKELSAVFDPERRPWIDLSAADGAAIKAQVERCPSGALSCPQSAEATAMAVDLSAAVVVEVLADGPLLVKSAHTLDMSDGTKRQRSGVTAYCRCGASRRKPFCDGSHARIGFEG